MSHCSRLRRWSRSPLLLLAGLALFCLAPLTASAQQKKDPSASFLRSNSQFISAFRPVISRASQSTVRILCDGEEAALGVVVGPDGWVLTKANDLKGKVACKLKDGRQLDARVVGVHQTHDLAMLKIEATGLTPIDWTESKVASVGHWVACAGVGEDPVGIGVVSVGTRNLPNKGGPLIPLPPANSGYLGISLEAIEGGIKITQVMPNSGAAKAKLQVDDLITELAGTKVTEVEAFIKAIQKYKIDDTVTLKIWRDDEEMDLKVTLGRRPPNRGDVQNNMGSKLSSRTTGYATILQHDSVVEPQNCGGPIVDLDGKVIGLNICRAGRTESWALPSEVIIPLLGDLMSGKLAPVSTKENTASQLSPTEKVKAQQAALKQAEAELKMAQAKVAAARLALDKALAEEKAAKKDQPKKEEKAKEAPKQSRLESAPEVQPFVAVDEVLHEMYNRLRLMHDVARWKWNAGQPIADAEREKAFLDLMAAKAKEHRLDPAFVRSFFRPAG